MGLEKYICELTVNGQPAKGGLETGKSLEAKLDRLEKNRKGQWGKGSAQDKKKKIILETKGMGNPIKHKVILKCVISN